MPNNTNLTSDPQAVPQALFSESSTAVAGVGQRVVSPDGRVFRYVKNGSVAMVVGKLYSCPAETTAHENLAVAAAAIGDTTVTTTSTVTVTANQYSGGYMLVTTSAGVGYNYLIASHPAATSAAVTLTLADPIQIALTTGSRIDLVNSPYNGVILSPFAVNGAPVGVAVYPVTASYFGWLQTGGLANVLADGTVTVGSLVAVSAITNGAASVTGLSQTSIGYAEAGIASTEYGAVRLTLDQ